MQVVLVDMVGMIEAHVFFIILLRALEFIYCVSQYLVLTLCLYTYVDCELGTSVSIFLLLDRASELQM